MPYASAKELPQNVKDKIKSKTRRRQWMHVFNNALTRHGDESRAFAEAWAATKRSGGVSKGTTMTGDFKFFLPLEKVDKERRLVSGYASTPTKDMDGEIISLDAIKTALPSYMAWGNIREMHRLSAVGKANEANVDKRGLYLTAKIVDDAAWQKCLEGVYKGFSIGGRKLEKVGDTITEIEMTEISVVDRPANPDCRITVAKRAKDDASAGAVLVKAPKDEATQTLKKAAKVLKRMAKAGPPAAHDGFSLPAKKATNPSPKDPSVENNKSADNGHVHEIPGDGVTGPPEDPDEIDKGGDMPGQGSHPYGDVEYADPGYQADKKKRYPVDSEKHVRAAWSYIHQGDNRSKYTSEQVSHIEGKIRAAGKKFDIDFDTDDKKASKKATKRAKKLAKREAKQRLALVLTEADSPPGVLDVMELRKVKGKAAQLVATDTDLVQLAAIVGQEAIVADGQGLNLSKGVISMDGTDGLSKAILDVIAKAAQPTRAQRMENARKNIKEARKVRKAAQSAIEDCHKMLKASYLSKAAKKDKDAAPDEFDHAGAMEKLQKAYGELTKMKTFMKAADVQIKKAAGRSGQRGQEVSDGEGDVYRVPPGVKDLSPSDLATASPGGDGRGSTPPMYPVDGSPYPGKAAKLAKFAKDGNVPLELVEVFADNARLEGENEALRNIPARAGGRRPYSFDVTKTFGNASEGRDFKAALFRDVDPMALASDDENARNSATAKVIGNLLLTPNLGKSVASPDFKGAAG